MPASAQECEEPKKNSRCELCLNILASRFPPSSPGMGEKGKVTYHNSRARVKLPAYLVGREDSGVAVAILLLGPLQDVYAPFFPGPLPCAALGVTVKGMGL
jgi:hypothetical protein